MDWVGGRSDGGARDGSLLDSEWWRSRRGLTGVALLMAGSLVVGGAITSLVGSEVGQLTPDAVATAAQYLGATCLRLAAPNLAADADTVLKESGGYRCTVNLTGASNQTVRGVTIMTPDRASHAVDQYQLSQNSRIAGWSLTIATENAAGGYTAAQVGTVGTVNGQTAYGYNFTTSRLSEADSEQASPVHDPGVSGDPPPGTEQMLQGMLAQIQAYGVQAETDLERAA